MITAYQSALDSSKSVFFKLNYDPIHRSCSEVSGLQKAFEMTHIIKYKIAHCIAHHKGPFCFVTEDIFLIVGHQED